MAELFDLDVDLRRGPGAERERLALRLARHPSESARHLVLRALARCVLDAPGLELGGELCRGDEPALAVPAEGAGRARLWVLVGDPGPRRVARALRKADAVRIVTDRRVEAGTRRWRALLDTGRLGIVTLPAELVAGLAGGLARRQAWSVTTSGGPVDDIGDELGGELEVVAGGRVLRGAVDLLE